MEQSAINIIQTLQIAGYIAYLAGGYVRDSIMNRESKDCDIVTNATPDQVKECFPKAEGVGAHFGVMLVRDEGIHFEVATFRTDGPYKDNRRPESVEFTSPQEDAFRRDFTINGLYKDPISGDFHDYVDGEADIQNAIIRSIGEPADRFREDALRLMRAIRFAVTLNFTIEPHTWEGIKQCAHLIKNISVERIQQEFKKIILHEDRQKGLDLLVESGLMEHIIPEILELKGCEQPPQFHPEGNVYVHTHMMLGMLHKDPSLALCLAVLLHDIGKPDTFQYDAESERIRFNGHDHVGADITRVILNRMKYSKEIITNVVSMVKSHMKFISVSGMKKSTIRRFLARPTLQDDLELHRTDCLASNGNLTNYDFMQAKLKEFANELIIPEPIIKGIDLIERGFEPGAIFAQILKDVQEKQLNNELHTQEEALEFIAQHYPQAKT